MDSSMSKDGQCLVKCICTPLLIPSCNTTNTFSIDIEANDFPALPVFT